MSRSHPVHTPKRSARTWLRSTFNTTPRIIDGWHDLTDRMEPPEGTLERFAHLHPEVATERLPLVWEALLQWVRLRGRRLVIDSRNAAPLPVRLCQPSLPVDRLWQQLAEDEPTWRRLPELVQAMDRVPVRDHRSRDGLWDTYQQAYYDEFALRLASRHPCFMVGSTPPVGLGARHNARGIGRRSSGMIAAWQILLLRHLSVCVRRGYDSTLGCPTPSCRGSRIGSASHSALNTVSYFRRPYPQVGPLGRTGATDHRRISSVGSTGRSTA